MAPSQERSGQEVDSAEPLGVVQSVEPSGPAGLAALQQLAGPGVSGISPAAVMALQRSAGNQAAGRAIAGAAGARQLQRDLLDDIGNAVGDAFDARNDEERLDAEEELEDFRDETYEPLEDNAPSSDVGLFDAACDMRAGTLTITLKVGLQLRRRRPDEGVGGLPA